jgi:hypothetical protein
MHADVCRYGKLTYADVCRYAAWRTFEAHWELIAERLMARYSVYLLY